MIPFSPLYFIKQNKVRCILLMFMIFLGYSAYVGGVYITNIMDNWELPIEYVEKSVIAGASAGDENFEDFKAFKKELSEKYKLTVLELGNKNAFNWKTIMGFESGQVSTTFRSPEDFKTYCEYMNISCDFDSVKNGSLIMSDRFAKNRNLKIGDVVDKDYDAKIFGSFELDAVTSEDGYMLYFIDEEERNSPEIILFGGNMRGDELYDIVYGLQDEYNVNVQNRIKDNVHNQFKNINMIYTFIVMFTSVILAITINAAFVGMYQRRNYEFSVYRAIGISRRRIVLKIIGELLCMDIIALAVGGAIVLIILYLFNNIALYPAGLYIRYFNMTALKGFIVCNMIVLIPLIITRCHQMLKADICEY